MVDKNIYYKYKDFIKISEEGFFMLNKKDQLILIENAEKERRNEYKKKHPWICFVLDLITDIINKIKTTFYKIINKLRPISNEFKNKVRNMHKNLTKKINILMNSNNIQDIIINFNIIIKFISIKLKENIKHLCVDTINNSFLCILEYQKEFTDVINNTDKEKTIQKK